MKKRKGRPKGTTRKNGFKNFQPNESPKIGNKLSGIEFGLS